MYQQVNTEIRASMRNRLAAERERLRKTQGEMAEMGGKPTRTYQDWENGKGAISTEYLAAAAVHGLDVLYVLTGERSQGEAQVLDVDEAKVLDYYRACDQQGRDHAMAVLSALARTTPLIRQLRRTQPNGPVVVVEGRADAFEKYAAELPEPPIVHRSVMQRSPKRSKP